MNRRGFLKLCGIAVAGLGLPAVSASTAIATNGTDPIRLFCVPKQFQWPEKFDPGKGCSHGVRFTAHYDPKTHDKAKKLLIETMKSYVPPAYWGQVEYSKKPINYGEAFAISWAYDPPGRRMA